MFYKESGSMKRLGFIALALSVLLVTGCSRTAAVVRYARRAQWDNGGAQVGVAANVTVIQERAA